VVVVVVVVVDGWMDRGAHRAWCVDGSFCFVVYGACEALGSAA